MKYRRLGRTGFKVSEIGYGAWGIGGRQWMGGTDDESLCALKRAIELGVNFIDTALAYNEGHSERLVGAILRETREPIRVATKAPPKNRLWPARPGIGIEQVFPYDHVIQSTEESLKNLGVDVIDLQQFHVWNPEWIAREEWRRAFEDLKRSGKVRAVGVSINDHDPDSALELMRTGLIDTVQAIYNVFDQTPERNLFPLAQELDIGVIARVPLDEGGLTGAVFSWRPEEAGCGARQCVAAGPRWGRGRIASGNRAALHHHAPRRIHRDPRHAPRAKGGSERAGERERSAGPQNTGHTAPSRLAAQLLRLTRRAAAGEGAPHRVYFRLNIN